MSLEKLRETEPDIENETAESIIERSRLIKSETRYLSAEVNRIRNEISTQSAIISDNMDKVKLNKQMPFLVGSFVEHVEPGSGVVVTSTRQSIYLNMLGPGGSEDLKPGDSLALHKDTNIILERLPVTYDSKVKAMELETKPTEDYSDIGGLEKQVEELYESVILPFQSQERFEALNIVPPKGVLMYGPPGNGKTLLARACAARTNATFLKLAGPLLVQMYIGDGAKLVRDAFALAEQKKPCIIFIDEVDAIGMKRAQSDTTGDREVQRTLLELLNGLDGFSVNSDVKVIAATNRVDILDPALLRSGRLDRKIEFPLPNCEGRSKIMKIHARNMVVADDVNFQELARSTEGFNGAQCKAVCVEAGMSAIKKGRNEISQIEFIEGISEVMSKKKSKINYFT